MTLERLGHVAGIVRSGAWLDSRRVRAYGLILFAVEVAAMVFLAAGQHGLIVPLDHPVSGGFSSFYAAGSLAHQGTPALAYDLAAHRRAEEMIYGAPGANYYFFFYPPVLLLACAALAALPYPVAFAVWAVGQAALYLGGIRAIVGRGGALVPYAAFPAGVISFALGQNALLTGALFAGGTVLLDRGRPFLAGLALGCLCYKPHFGILIPVALIAGGHWRAVAGAAAAVAALAGATVAAFGWDIWPAYVHLFADAAPRTFETGRVPYSAMVSPFGSVLLVGGAKPLAYAVQAVATLAAAVTVAVIWRATPRTAPRSVALIAGTLVSVPVILFYDLLPAAVCIAWLARDARDGGWLPWEKAFIIAIAILSLGGRGLAVAAAVPYGPVVGFGLLAMAWRRARHGQSRQWHPDLAPVYKS
ncbi:MAG: glycosyltransferase family 87 protein [Magnetospirillum sp.]|nr:glycosyltransferase family 87 protein [Magnetospirillum sp.]